MDRRLLAFYRLSEDFRIFLNIDNRPLEQTYDLLNAVLAAGEIPVPDAYADAVAAAPPSGHDDELCSMAESLLEIPNTLSCLAT